MSTTLQTLCTACGGVNRIPAERLESAGAAKCGRCHELLLPAGAQEVSAERFQALIDKSDIPVLADYWAPWCGPCRAAAPVLERAAQRLAPAIRVAKLNIDEAQEIARRRNIQAVPTLAVYRRGKELARMSGVLGERELIAWAKDAVSRA